MSEIQRAKFGVFVTYIFGGKIWGTNTNFRGRFWGQAPPQPPKMEVPPWGLATVWRVVLLWRFYDKIILEIGKCHFPLPGGGTSGNFFKFCKLLVIPAV